MASKFWKKSRDHINENLFHYSLYIKGFDSIVEIVSGILLNVITAQRINMLIISYAHDELTEEPHNRFASYFLNHGHLSIQAATFTSILLIARGIAKILVITGLLQRKLWVYPIAVLIFTAFFVFESYTYFMSHSLLLLLLAVFDLFVIFLTVREYRLLTSRLKRERC
jgi:uncharacterized membrane protein